MCSGPRRYYNRIYRQAGRPLNPSPSQSGPAFLLPLGAVPGPLVPGCGELRLDGILRTSPVRGSRKFVSKRQPIVPNVSLVRRVENDVRHRPPGAAGERLFALARVPQGNMDLVPIQFDPIVGGAHETPDPRTGNRAAVDDQRVRDIIDVRDVAMPGERRVARIHNGPTFVFMRC
jgi:hypothetical protein